MEHESVQIDRPAAQSTHYSYRPLLSVGGAHSVHFTFCLALCPLSVRVLPIPPCRAPNHHCGANVAQPFLRSPCSLASASRPVLSAHPVLAKPRRHRAPSLPLTISRCRSLAPKHSPPRRCKSSLLLSHALCRHCVLGVNCM